MDMFDGELPAIFTCVHMPELHIAGACEVCVEEDRLECLALDRIAIREAYANGGW